MSGCLRDLAALLSFTSSSSSLQSRGGDELSQSLVEYALRYDVDPSLLYSLLISALSLFSVALLLSVVFLLRLLFRSLRPPPSPSPLLSDLRHSVADLQSRLTIEAHAKSSAEKRLTEREKAFDEERRKAKAAVKKAGDDDAEARKEGERRLLVVRKELDGFKEEAKRLKDERIRLQAEGEERRHEDNKAKAKAKRDEKDERERRDREERRLTDLTVSLQRQLDERTAQLKEAEKRREEGASNMARMEDNLTRYRAEVKAGKDREEQMRLQLADKEKGPAVRAKGAEGKKGEEERKWVEMGVVTEQLQVQISSLQLELEAEKERKQRQDSDHSPQLSDKEVEARKAEEEQRSRQLSEQSDRIARLTQQLQDRDAQLSALHAEVTALKERQQELVLECSHEEEKSTELFQEVSDKADAIDRLTSQRSRLEAELQQRTAELAAGQDKAAELLTAVAVKEQQLATMKLWKDEVEGEMRRLYQGRETRLQGKMRSLLSWPDLGSRPAPPPILIPAASVPSSPVHRSPHATSSVPTSPSALSLRADLELYAQRLKEAQLILAESPKAKAGRKEKAKLVKKAREDVFELMKRKRELQAAVEREDKGGVDRRQSLPPVPLFNQTTEERAVETDEDAELAQLKAQVATVTSQLTEQTDAADKLRADLGDAQQRVATLLRTTIPTSKHHSAVDALQTQLTESQVQLHLSSDRVKELTSSIDSQAATISTLQSDVASARAELSSVQQSTIPQAEHTTAVDVLRSQVAALEQRLSASQDELSGAQSSLTSERSRASELSGKIAELTAVTSQSTAQAATDASTVASLRSQLSAVEQAKAELTAQLTALQSSLDSERSGSAELSRKVDDVTAQSSTAASTIAQLNAQLATQTERSTQLNSTCVTLTTQLGQRQAELDELTQLRPGLEAALKEQRDKAARLQTEVEEKEALCASLESQMFTVIREVQDRDADRRAVELQRQQDAAQWEERLLALRLSADTAVQAAEDDAEHSNASAAQLQSELDAAKAQLQTVEAKVAETEKRLAVAESQRDNAKRSLKGVESTCAGFLEDLRLKDAEVKEAREESALKEAELSNLRHLFLELEKKDADRGRDDDEAEERAEREHKDLNDSLLTLESAVQQSVQRRAGADQSLLIPALRDHTPVKARRFVFVTHDTQPQSTPSRSAPKSPRSGASGRTPVPASPSSAASAASKRADVAEAAAQVAALQATVLSLRAQVKEKEEALAEEERKAEAQQSTIDRLRQQAKGTRDGGLTALHRLQASQSRMEELNSKLSAKMQAIHLRKTSAQLPEAKDGDAADLHSRHASAPVLTFDPAALGVEVSSLLTQLGAEHALVLEQAKQLSTLRQQQQLDAAFHASLMQRLETSEDKRQRMRRQVRVQQEQWEAEKLKIEQLIEMSTAELEELEAQREERELLIAQLQADVAQWKAKDDEWNHRVDDWAQQQHEETSHRETKKEYLKRRWHELTYGGHRHCASCERAAANGGPPSAHSHSPAGAKTPVKKERAGQPSKSPPSSDLLQLPSPHRRSRSHSDVSDHSHHHHRNDSNGGVDASTAPAATGELDVDAVVAGWQSTVSALQKEAAHDLQTTMDLQALAEHLTQLTSKKDRANMSLSLNLTAASAISPASDASEALQPRQAHDLEQRLRAVQREKEEAQTTCLRMDRELGEERRLMKDMEAEVHRMRDELLARRRDEEEVHSVLKQAKLAMNLHSRKPSSLNSVASFNSATSTASSAYSGGDEHKEGDQGDDVYLMTDPIDAAMKETQRRYLDALREIDALQHLRREDEAKIEEAIRQLRNSREQVCKDYADMIHLSQQLTTQQRDIEALQAELQDKEALIADLRASRSTRSAGDASFGGNGSDALTESMIEGQLAEFESRFKALQRAMEEKEAQVAGQQTQLRSLQTECRELRDYISMQEGTIRKQETTISRLEKQAIAISGGSSRAPSHRPTSSSSSPSDPTAASPPPQEALMALAEVSKAYRAEQQLRQALQERLQLPVLTPVVSPSHTRQTSVGAAADSPRGALTPQRLSAAGLSELAWWQQRRRRTRGSSASTSFSSPAHAVLSSLAGAFTNEGSDISTPVRSRQSLESSKGVETASPEERQ